MTKRIWFVLFCIKQLEYFLGFGVIGAGRSGAIIVASTRYPNIKFANVTLALHTQLSHVSPTVGSMFLTYYTEKSTTNGRNGHGA